MRWGAIAGCLLMTAAVSGDIGAAEPEGSVGDVRATRKGSVRRVDAWLPGRVQSMVTLTDDRGAAMWLFVPSPHRDNGAPPPADSSICGDPQPPDNGELWRFDPDAAGGPQLERVLEGLPSGPGRLQVLHRDGSGTPELIAILRGGIYLLPRRPGARPELLASGPEFDPRTTFVTEFASEPSPLVVTSDLGQASYFRLTAQGLEPLRTVELPIQARYRRNEFRLGTRQTTPIGTYGGSPAYSDYPEQVGSQRLAGHLVRPTRDAETLIEWWARLPEPEELLEMRYFELDDEPALFVTSRPANKLALFGEKRLRLYRLAADRSQTGHQPFFAVKTRANLWQTIVPYVRDIDGDGDDDLVLAYWKGLTDSRVVLDAYLGDGAGSFAPDPGSSGFDVKKGERSYVSWEHDVTGDGVTDLLVIGKGHLQIHAGDATARKGRNLVDTKPAHKVLILEGAKGDEEVEVDIEVDADGMQFEGERLSTRGAPLVDLDGDGTYEVLFSASVGTAWKLSFVRFAR